jgi:hypothetical protein
MKIFRPDGALYSCHHFVLQRGRRDATFRNSSVSFLIVFLPEIPPAGADLQSAPCSPEICNFQLKAVD